MRRHIVTTIMIVVFLVLRTDSVSGAVTSGDVLTMGEQYAMLYEESPVSIVIMPPINLTTHAKAKDYFYSTMYQPLCEKGYYVFSPYLTKEVLRQEELYDSEMFLEADLSIFRDSLGADAAMFTIIKSWERNSLDGILNVNVEYILRSTKTGLTLYEREGDITLDNSVDDCCCDDDEYSSNDFFGDMLANIISSAMTKKITAGRTCNSIVLSDLPAGKYSPDYQKDAYNPAGSRKITATVR